MGEPFLKWAGGKRWLAASGLLPSAFEYERYIEPFLGGGAVFFYYDPQIAILADVNAELILLYRVVRDQPEAFKELLKLHQKRHCREYYYLTRATVPTDDLSRAARTLYLNRTCWNGLYRVNQKNQFNVPIGTKNAVIYDNEDFTKIALTLKRAELRCADFEEAIAEAREGDFLFIDPPYTVQHNMNGFVKYNENIFSWSDQLRLRRSIEMAIRRGAAVAVTNADHESIRSLYQDLQYRQLRRASVLAGFAHGRGATTEALFLANLTRGAPNSRTRL